MTKVEIKGKQLIITMDMEAEPQLSKSQKNLVLASTHGNEKTTAEYKGETNHNRSQRLRQGLM